MQQGLLGNLLWFINQEEGGIIHPHTQRRFFIFFFFPVQTNVSPGFPVATLMLGWEQKQLHRFRVDV